MLRTLIQRKDNAMRSGESKSDDLLGILLQSNNQNNLQIVGGTNSNNQMSMANVIEECKLFYLAGHETTKDEVTILDLVS